MRAEVRLSYSVLNNTAPTICRCNSHGSMMAASAMLLTSRSLHERLSDSHLLLWQFAAQTPKLHELS